LLLDKVENHLL